VFLGTCLGSDSPVAEAIAEADEKGSATRTMEYAPDPYSTGCHIACDALLKPLNHRYQSYRLKDSA